MKWLAWDPNPPTLQMVEQDCRTHHAEFIQRSFIRYLIIEKETGQVVGRCAYPNFQVVWAIPQFGISYFIRRQARKKGYAAEAAHAMSVLAFRVLKAKKVENYCDAENIGSEIVAKRLGYVLECTKKGGWARTDDKLADLHTYALFSEESLPKWEVKWNK